MTGRGESRKSCMAVICERKRKARALYLCEANVAGAIEEPVRLCLHADVQTNSSLAGVCVHWLGRARE